MKTISARALACLVTLLTPVIAPQTWAESTLESCHVDDISTAVECGSLDVPLDYGDPEGDFLSIGFVVLPSYNPSSATAPLFFLAGGPGQSATSLAAQVNEMFSKLRSDRDIVLVDQRGTGRSAELACDIEEPDDLAPQHEFIDPEILAACIEQLPEGIRHFTTANAVRDFEAVRRHLAYPVIDLYGGSYGSRAAIAYLALAGDAVRAVVLDGVSPPSVPIGLFGASAASAYERAIDRCHSIDECRAAYPDLRQQFRDVDAALRTAPAEGTVPHPLTGEATAFRLWHAQFLSMLRLTLYAPSSTALLPAVISQASQGNYLPLAALMASVSDSGFINIMLNLTIVCNEDFPRFSGSSVAADGSNAFGGDTSYRLWSNACAQIPRFDADLAWMEAGDFSQPALLLSGAGDPVTPPSNGDAASSLFQTARHIVAEEAAHIVAGSECGGQMIAAFLEDPDPQAVDTDCLSEMPAQRFLIDTMGSLSPAVAGAAP